MTLLKAGDKVYCTGNRGLEHHFKSDKAYTMANKSTPGQRIVHLIEGAQGLNPRVPTRKVSNPKGASRRSLVIRKDETLT